MRHSPTSIYILFPWLLEIRQGILSHFFISDPPLFSFSCSYSILPFVSFSLPILFFLCFSLPPFPFPLPIERARCRCLLSYFPWVSNEIEGHWKTNDSRCLHCVKQTRRGPRAITSRTSYYVSLFNPGPLAERPWLVLHLVINLTSSVQLSVVCSTDRSDLRLWCIRVG
jgi:hypothetical protein